jgi:hypothetical protein
VLPDSWVTSDGRSDGSTKDQAGPDVKPDTTAPDQAAGSDAAKVSYSGTIQKIWNNNCTKSTCHTGSSPASSLDLTASRSHAALVGKSSVQCTSIQRVKAGDPGASYLMDKLSGKGGSCYKGDQMPKGSTPLITADVDKIRTWIQQGAANN